MVRGTASTARKSRTAVPIESIESCSLHFKLHLHSGAQDVRNMVHVSQLFLYPIKSCGAIPVERAVITPTGARSFVL
jgi:hypothetical protein